MRAREREVVQRVCEHAARDRVERRGRVGARAGQREAAEQDGRGGSTQRGEDLARIACLALFRAGPGRAYNASDDSGLRMGEYFDAVAERFGLARPPRMARAEIVHHLSPLTLSFMSESRRLDNRRLKRELRLRLRYPTVADGLRAATVPAA